MRYRIAKRFKFSAAHRLECLDPLDPCQRVHGHTFWVEVVLASNELENGMVAQFEFIRQAIQPFIDDHLEHRYLNDLMENPTTERLAEKIFNHAEPILQDLLESVKVEEGPNNWAKVTKCGSYREEPNDSGQ